MPFLWPQGITLATVESTLETRPSHSNPLGSTIKPKAVDLP